MSAFLVYLLCLVVGASFVMFGAIFGHIFGGDGGQVDGSHGHVEAGADSSDSPGVSAFSPMIISSFLTVFGGLGLIFTQIPRTASVFVSAPLSVLGALGGAGCIMWFLRQLFSRTESSSESKVATLVGMSATIATPIPPHGVGEIVYIQAGSRYTAPAREENGLAVANGQPVKITRIVGGQFYVVSV